MVRFNTPLLVVAASLLYVAHAQPEKTLAAESVMSLVTPRYEETTKGFATLMDNKTEFLSEGERRLISYAGPIECPAKPTKFCPKKNDPCMDKKTWKECKKAEKKGCRLTYIGKSCPMKMGYQCPNCPKKKYKKGKKKVIKKKVKKVKKVKKKGKKKKVVKKKVVKKVVVTKWTKGKKKKKSSMC
eukprot:CAMPEP_0116840508 /NCGR_PEP_ID=MMETSP0418-20121206/10397_1 /TAXON_ID=1158023 /ORGANISM="Astrosyne radiata, Strain 13vi08-1A" /LENGTH=184 /DNA_ID=CAMNT_0004470809 /DNA_START=56 /DNA_END=607 /DNA_ORIENTATION=-